MQGVKVLRFAVEHPQAHALQALRRIVHHVTPQRGWLRRHLGRRGGRGCAQIGDKISNREIGFMADAADQGNWALRDHLRQGLVIEGPQIFHRPAAAHQQNHIDGAMRRVLQTVDFLQRSAERLGRGLTLHGRRYDRYGNMGNPPLQGRQHVV